LDETRKDYGGDKVNWNDPMQQAVAGLKYIKAKYGDPVKALQFWDEKKWY
jgi:SLT domain-containing protein